jgi:hypothetical protein
MSGVTVGRLTPMISPVTVQAMPTSPITRQRFTAAQPFTTGCSQVTSCGEDEFILTKREKSCEEAEVTNTRGRSKEAAAGCVAPAVRRGFRRLSRRKKKKEEESARKDAAVRTEAKNRLVEAEAVLGTGWRANVRQREPPSSTAVPGKSCRAFRCQSRLRH